MRTWIALPFAVVALACVMALVPFAEGVPVVYNELVSGDVDGRFFTFDIGTNTIFGSYVHGCVGSACNFPELQDPDWFGFSIPPGTKLVELTADFQCCFGSFSLAGPSVSATFEWPPVNYGGLFEAPIPGNPLPWESGSYRGQSGSCFNAHSESADGVFTCFYQFDFTVARVAEPSASFLVLGAGVAGLSGFAWWERRRHRGAGLAARPRTAVPALPARATRRVRPPAGRHDTYA